VEKKKQTNKKQERKNAVADVMDFLNTGKALWEKKLKKPNIGGPCGRNSM